MFLVEWCHYKKDWTICLHGTQFKWEDKCHINQLRCRYVEDQTRQEVRMEVQYDIFELPIPQSITTKDV